MRSVPWRSLLVLGLVAVFVAVGIGAVLPHSHNHVAASHDCVFCRAHAAPLAEAPAPVSPAWPDRPTGLVESPLFALDAQSGVVVPFGRAPPFLS